MASQNYPRAKDSMAPAKLAPRQHQAPRPGPVGKTHGGSVSRLIRMAKPARPRVQCVQRKRSSGKVRSNHRKRPILDRRLVYEAVSATPALLCSRPSRKMLSPESTFYAQSQAQRYDIGIGCAETAVSCHDNLPEWIGHNPICTSTGQAMPGRAVTSASSSSLARAESCRWISTPSPLASLFTKHQERVHEPAGKRQLF